MNKITILSFSGRPEGNCRQISGYIQNYHRGTDVRIFIFDGFSPCGHCDYACLRPSQSCPSKSAEYTRMMDRICESDLVYFIVPNYCSFPCASFFAFNERSVGYFSLDHNRLDQYMAVKKRFVIVSNTESLCFTEAMQQQTSETPDMLYLKTSKYQKQSIAGNLLESEAARDDLRTFLDAYIF